MGGRRPSGAGFLFVSTSGHELGGLGMRAFMNDLAPPPERVLCWIHLGAGIATYSWGETATGLKRLEEPIESGSMMTSRDLVSILSSTFAGLPGLTRPLTVLLASSSLLSRRAIERLELPRVIDFITPRRTALKRPARRYWSQRDRR